MISVKDDIKKAERIEEITGILFKQELGYILDKLNLLNHLPIHKKIQAKRHSKPGPERVKETIEELGTVYIKFGQIMSERPDLIPKKYCKELKNLQDSAPQFSSEKAKNIVDKEIGLDTFQEFEEEPIAAASIAQVHQAKLQNGEQVVVKIRRPNIKEKVKRDLKIIQSAAKKIDKHLDTGDNFLQGEVKEFAEWTKSELDFTKERQNAKAFKNNMEEEEGIRVPKTYPRHSNEKVLVMEYIDAVKCDNLEKINQMDINGEDIADRGINSILKQILRDGLLHADPHPSNFMIDQEENLVFIDFGMMTRLTPETQRQLGMLILNISQEDIDGVIKTLKELAVSTQNLEEQKLKDDLERQILRLRDSTVEQESISSILIQLSIKSSKHGLYLPTKITLIGKGLITMEGIALKIYPDFKMGDKFQKQVEKLIIKQNKPKDMMKDFTFNLIQNRDLITKSPEKIKHRLDEGHEIDPEIDVKTGNIDLLPTGLIISSTGLLAASTQYPILLYFGILELLLGLHLHRK